LLLLQCRDDFQYIAVAVGLDLEHRLVGFDGATIWPLLTKSPSFTANSTIVT